MNSSVAAIHVNWAQSHHQSFSKRSTWALFCGKFCHFCCLCLIHLLVQNLQYILNVLILLCPYSIHLESSQYILNVFNIFQTYSICFECIPNILYRFNTFCTWSAVRFYQKNWHFNLHDWRCTNIYWVLSKSKYIAQIQTNFVQADKLGIWEKLSICSLMAPLRIVWWHEEFIRVVPFSWNGIYVDISGDTNWKVEMISIFFFIIRTSVTYALVTTSKALIKKRRMSGCW